jgi:hypothetical protein
MKRLSQLEVEPLSEQRWSKIERSLVSELALEANDVEKSSLEQPRRRLSGRAWLLAAALLGALGGAVIVAHGLPERAAVEQPSRITTGTSASHLALPGLAVDVEPESTVVISDETPHGRLIVLDRGSIVCQVAPRSGSVPLIVQAGATRVRVVGTRFSVTRLGESARVEVQQGVVEVSSRGGTYLVHAGEEWPTEVAEPAPVGPSPIASAVPPKLAHDVERAAAAAERRVPVASKVKGAPEVPGSANGASRESSPMTPPFSPQAVFEQATLLERTDPERASKLYGTLDSRGDSWAQNALYARGRLEATRGNRVEARRLLELYLDRFPNGSNAQDARAVLKRLK